MMETLISTVSYCDIQGGYSGVGNINQDPLFVMNESLPNPAAGPDGIFRTSDDGLRLGGGNPHNPCINTANDGVAPPTDILDIERVGIADMGAYEYTTEELPLNKFKISGGKYHTLLLQPDENGDETLWVCGNNSPQGDYSYPGPGDVYWASLATRLITYYFSSHHAC